MRQRQTDSVGSVQLMLWVVVMGFLPVVLISGCKQEEIRAYRVPKEMGNSAPVAQEETHSQEVGWSVPDSWREAETTNSMRLATFMTESDLEVAITAFPGDVGGLLANVNRWRGQIGLPPIDEQSLESHVEALDGSDVIIVDEVGTDQRLIGTVISVGDGKTWFVKVMGAEDAVGQIKSDLVAFSASFHLHKHDEAAASPAGGATAPPPSDLVHKAWDQPREWKVDPSASPILTAAFLADGGARITLTTLTGQGGGILDNINRWRGQLGLEPVQSMTDQPVQDLGDGALLVDLQSDDGAQRIVAGIIPNESHTLFFKLTGSSSEVENELKRFVAFVHGTGLRKRGES